MIHRRILGSLTAIVSVLAWTGVAQATEGNGSTLRERGDYHDSVQVSQGFLDCVDRAANANDDQAAVDDAVQCFQGILADDFTITIDGVAGSRTFADPESFIAFATGPANAIRVNVSILPGVYTALGFDGRGRIGRSVKLRTIIDIVQTIVAPNPVFGSILGGQNVRGQLDFTVSEVQRNVWRITASRFSVFDLENALDIQSLPRPMN